MKIVVRQSSPHAYAWAIIRNGVAVACGVAATYSDAFGEAVDALPQL